MHHNSPSHKAKSILSKIYFHAPCFDGLISAVIAREYLTKTQNWVEPEMLPVTYHRDDWWLRQNLQGYSAVLDFMYHPDARFWVDHHGSTFKQTEDLNEMRRHYENSRTDTSRTLVYDPTYPAGAKLLWDFIKGDVNDHERFAEMVRWATITDSATYETAQQAVFGEEPALRIASSLGTSIDDGRILDILKLLRTHTLDEAANEPIIAERFAANRPRVEHGIEALRKTMQIDGTIGSAEMTIDDTLRPSVFAGFLLAPEIKYMLTLTHGPKGHKVYASRNPWNGATKVHLGDLFETYGGGGHFGVGSYLYEPEATSAATKMYREITERIATDDP